MRPALVRTTRQNARPLRGLPGLAAAVASIAAVWLVGLPWLGERPALRAKIERERAAGIDPGAMFYTELPAMGRVLARMRRLESERPTMWWVPRSAAHGP